MRLIWKKMNRNSPEISRTIFSGRRNFIFNTRVSSFFTGNFLRKFHPLNHKKNTYLLKHKTKEILFIESLTNNVRTNYYCHHAHFVKREKNSD